MKKLMIAAAIVCAAVVSNAATCSWSVTQIPVDPTSAAVTTYYAYLCDSAVTSLSDMTTALGKGDVSKLTGKTVVTTSNVTSFGGGKVSKTGFGDYTAGDTYTYYTILLNNTDSSKASYYMATATVTATVPDKGGLQMGFNSQASNTWNKMGSEPEPTPEPTSALLMLLGVAGLALRRKQK